MLHAKWMRDKLADGWRYGIKFNQREKTNPMLKPWHELSNEYKNVDKSIPQLFLDFLNDEGYVVLSQEDFDSLSKRALTAKI